MDAITRTRRVLPTSVQGSETTVDALRKSGVVCTAAELAERKRRPLWATTPPQARMHSRNRPQRETILVALNESDDPALRRRTRRIEACCVCPLFCLDSKGGVAVAPGFCRDRMCPTCAAIRGRQVQQRVRSAIASMDQVRFLTLTIADSDAPLEEQLDHLYASFRRLRQQKVWAAHVRGGVAVLENTRNPKTGRYHPHLHVLIDGVYFPHDVIRSAWREATGDSSIVHIVAVHSRDAAARYISTYVAKPADVLQWPAESIREYASALHGRRLVVAFGSMHGKLGDPDDDGTSPQITGVLCSALRLDAARNRGCPYAVLAAGLLVRLGGMRGRAAGDDVHRTSAPGGGLAIGDLARLVTALKRVGGDDSAWLPEVEPTRKFNGQSNGGRRPKDANMRLWLEPESSGWSNTR